MALSEQNFDAEWFAVEFKMLVAKAHKNNVRVTAKGSIFVFDDKGRYEVNLARKEQD